MANSVLKSIKQTVNNLKASNESIFNRNYDNIHNAYVNLSDYELLRKERYLSDKRKSCLVGAKYIFGVAILFSLLSLVLDIWALNQGTPWKELHKTSLMSAGVPFIFFLLFIAMVFFAFLSELRERLNVIADIKYLRRGDIK